VIIGIAIWRVASVGIDSEVNVVLGEDPIARRRLRYCHLQFQKRTIEDQQRSLLEIIEGYNAPKAE